MPGVGGMSLLRSQLGVWGGAGKQPDLRSHEETGYLYLVTLWEVKVGQKGDRKGPKGLSA